MPKLNCPNTLKFTLIALLCLALISICDAQHKITGYVFEPDGSPDIGANIVLWGSTIGTITDFGGKFTLETPSSSGILVLSADAVPHQSFAIAGRSLFIIRSGGIGLNGKNSFEHYMVEGIGDYEIRNFNLPPPDPTAQKRFPKKLFKRISTLADLDTALHNALYASGYIENLYLPVHDGFALITRLEKMNTDGTSTEGEDRWDTTAVNNNFGIQDGIKQLSNKLKGQYRAFVIVVTTDMSPRHKDTLSEWELVAWSNSEGLFLPTSIGRIEFTNKHKVHALIYEFVCAENDGQAVLVQESKMTWEAHMMQSKLLSKLMTY